MLNISNDTPPTDYIDYFTRQLPVDLANMAKLRDELAVRQGALTAVEDAARDRAVAKDELEGARRATKAMFDDANAQKDAAQALEAQVTADRNALGARIAAFDDASAKAEAVLAKRIAAADKRENDLAMLADSLTARSAQLDKDALALEARVKAFQEKVASLSA
jgi:chromosome segregation ATPase